jgi:serine/threonine protein kinase
MTLNSNRLTKFDSAHTDELHLRLQHVQGQTMKLCWQDCSDSSDSQLPVSAAAFWQLPAFASIFNAVKTSDSCLQTVKTGRQRTIFCWRNASNSCYIKRYHLPDAFEKIKRVLSGCQAQKEWHDIQAVIATGIPTSRPLWWGEYVDGPAQGVSFLALTSIDDATALKDLLQQTLWNNSVELRHSVLQQLAEITARLHNHAVFHRDLHAENFLWQSTSHAGQTPGRLFLIDLKGITRHKSLSLQQIKLNLGQIYYSIGRELSEYDCRVFWEHYWENLNPNFQQLLISSAAHIKHASAAEAVLQMLIPAFRAHVEQSLQVADRKWSRGNRRLIILQQSAKTCRGLAKYGKHHLQQLMQSPQTVLNNAISCDWVKQSSSRSIAQMKLPVTDGHIEHVYVKQMEMSIVKSWFPQWGKQYQPVRQCWEMGHALLRRKIPTPTPEWMIESRNGWKYQGILATQALPESVALSAYLEVYLPDWPITQTENWIVRYSAPIALSLATLHQSRFDHRDLKSNNILVSRDSNATAYWLIDLDAMRKWPISLPESRRIQNLARLAFDAEKSPAIRQTHLLRFLKAYLRQSAGYDYSDADWKRVWKLIAVRICSLSVRKEKRQSPSPAIRRVA